MEIAGGARVTGVEKPMYGLGLLAAGSGRAFENMCLTTINILNRRDRFEKSIHRCVPSLHETA
jgi:hypothetical protein